MDLARTLRIDALPVSFRRLANHTLAAKLHYERHRIAILGRDFGVLFAGKQDDGGVDGLNRRFSAVRQIADADRAADGRLRHNFIGLYDNDHAGRIALQNACRFDPRLRRCRDLFLLHPIMPSSSGADYGELERRFERQNAAFRGLDWEIEDLLSERLLDGFQAVRPDAIQRIRECGGRKHRDLTREGKRRLHEYVEEYALLEDLVEIVRLVRALRDYVGVRNHDIVC
jgi:hypothetical protein